METLNPLFNANFSATCVGICYLTTLAVANTEWRKKNRPAVS